MKVDDPTDDVLASLRRLTAGTADLPVLVLTPDLRVPAQPGEVHDRLAPIDEDVLHELVRDLLAEELQGPLGEKITRNIRKMVRAEIARELAMRDLK
ncbi:hypothetical protein [Falsirhodobacter halotolerans]|uniref:hypothetical protein n=1 Tax=Falsirhodobacter halotolerans TaxID=1146892 RepID=UPI001FD3582B|nr:hypothetical protein [Falsirhodobacter halotolerans]MCJ8139438.1 hypothetical protein [Falsirhodobacter halotolerans]